MNRGQSEDCPYFAVVEAGAPSAVASEVENLSRLIAESPGITAAELVERSAAGRDKVRHLLGVFARKAWLEVRGPKNSKRYYPINPDSEPEAEET